MNDQQLIESVLIRFATAIQTKFLGLLSFIPSSIMLRLAALSGPC